MRYLACGLLLLLGGCAVNPVTGDHDFVMLTEQQELAIGKRSFSEIVTQHPLYADPKLTAYVEQVGQKLASNSHRSNLQYRFFIVDSADLNAFALPGGYIFINRGLLAYLNSEAELAAVLGHEIGHVTARHGVRQQSQAMAWNILGELVAVGVAASTGSYNSSFRDLTNIAGMAVVRGYGRDMELQADTLGAQYLAVSGYNPEAMTEVVELLKDQSEFARAQAAEKGQQPDSVGGYHGLFDTHPDHAERLAHVVGSATGLVRAEQIDNRAAFLEHLEGLPIGDSQEQGVRRGQNYYHGPMDFTLSIPTGWEFINRSDVLLMQTQDQQALFALTLASHEAQLTAEELLRKELPGARLVQQESFERGAWHGATAVVPGTPAKRVAVLVKDQVGIRLMGQVKAPASLESQDMAFMSILNSFRSLTPQEREKAKPPVIHVVQVQPGDTLESLAASADLTGDKAAKIRLLNGLYPSGAVQVGESLKLVR